MNRSAPPIFGMTEKASSDGDTGLILVDTAPALFDGHPLMRMPPSNPTRASHLD